MNLCKIGLFVALGSILSASVPQASPAAPEGVSIEEKPLTIVHVTLKSRKPYGVVKANIEKLGRLDDSVRAYLRKGDIEGFRSALARIAGADGLALHYTAQLGDMAALEGKRLELVGYFIGNVLSAEKMTKVDLAAGLYAPLRVVVYANTDGGTTLEYDKPSSLFGQFGSPAIDEVAKSLDERLLRFLKKAAG